MNGYKVVLTADRTLMSNYGGGLFYGFITTAPCKGFFFSLPQMLYTFIFKPVKADKYGRAQLAPHGLRRIEAAIVESGVVSPEEIVVSPPEKLRSVVGEKTAIIGISANDPLGKGPASTTIAGETGVIHEEPHTAFQFRKLVTSKVVQDARKRGAKVVVGGAGAWQIGLDVMKRYGIDFVVDGEGEIVTPKLFKKILNGEKLETPRIIKTKFDEYPDADQIPLLRGATVGGVVEVSRGCGRGCRFCTPTLRRLRHRSMENIIKDVETNIRFGQNAICLHAEDFFRYGSYDYAVKHDKVIELITKILKLKGLRSLGPSHIALVSIATSPKTAEAFSELIISRLNQPWVAYQTGIETGSPRLIEMYMDKKLFPYKPKDWPEVVERAFAVSADYNLIPCATVIVNLPGETEEDVNKTIELLEKLKPYKSFIAPLLFVPARSDLHRYRFMRLIEDAKPWHIELYRTIWRHDVRWLESLSIEYIKHNNPLTKLFIRMFVKYVVSYANRVAEKFFNEKLKSLESKLQKLASQQVFGVVRN
ncbi:MAG: B12-binding domain-containing radical SAM protein [Candidatus Bathyarchaeota archaeon]